MRQPLLQGVHFAEWALSAAYDLRIPATEGERVWTLLREIADGKVTLAGSPADILYRAPKAGPKFVERVWGNANRLVAQDCDLARRILSAFQRLVDDMKTEE